MGTRKIIQKEYPINKNNMKICFIGTYDKNYTGNKIVLEGLLRNKVKVSEVNAEVKLTRLDSKKDMTWMNMAKRLAKKYRFAVVVGKNIDKIKNSDIFYVGYPGHMDVLLVYPLAKTFNKKIAFAPVISFYSGFSDEQGILNKGSVMATISKYGETLVYKCVDLVLPDTPYQKEFFQKTFNIPERKLRVLPIGADDKYYKHTPYKNKSKKINVVYYGLYSPIHGVEYIIEAANLLKNDRDIKFTFVGQGNTFEENYNRAQKLHLENVEFFHDIPVEEHPAIIEKADIFLGFLEKHPTVERVIPNKVYQGLALGKVVVTTDVPVIRSIFTHKENMYFTKPASAEELAKAIKELKEKPVLRKKIADNGYALFKKKFTPKAVGNQLLHFMEEVI
ncbi:MAG: glycosyltransferase [Candidatus Curtissbacteria bacterium]|nr:glycosyltransferase [Candidatus Curtissbacteria bacterium]